MKALSEVLSHVIESLPAEIRQQIERTQADHGLWCLSSTTGGLWMEDIPDEVEELLFGMLKGHLVEIVIRPEDVDAHHWSVSWHLLEPDESGRLVRVDTDR